MWQEEIEDRAARVVYNETERGAVVEPAYDEAGDITHFVTRLSHEAFRALYPAGFVSAIFLQGYWLQLALNLEENWFVVLRDTGETLQFTAMDSEEADGCSLSFYREGQELYTTTYEGVSLELLLGSEDGLLLIVQEALGVFQGLSHVLLPQRKTSEEGGDMTIQIVPEDLFNFFNEENVE